MTARVVMLIYWRVTGKKKEESMGLLGNKSGYHGIILELIATKEIYGVK